MIDALISKLAKARFWWSPTRPPPFRFRQAAFFLPPLLRNKYYDTPSSFTPESLLRESRRQKAVPNKAVPEVCILDPDGDIVRYLRTNGRARPVTEWACYHSMMDCFNEGGRDYGIVGCTVGASYAVLVAEQLFASGCRLLLSMSSSGQITMLGRAPYFVLIERALRDEGTSYHYLPPGRKFAEANPVLLSIVEGALAALPYSIDQGTSWTTDAPYRETEQAIAAARDDGILAVEMEAAALYAFAEARKKSVLCFAYVTNQLGQAGDFEKGETNGARASLDILREVADSLANVTTHQRHRFPLPCDVAGPGASRCTVGFHSAKF